MQTPEQTPETTPVRPQTRDKSLGTVSVRVVRGTGLVAADSGGTSDPYVMVSVSLPLAQLLLTTHYSPLTTHHSPLTTYLVLALQHLAALLRHRHLGLDEHAGELLDLAPARFELRLQGRHLP